jgi:long-chain acyl-CoA synthetase
MPAFGAESGSPDPATAMPGAYAIAAQQPGKCAIIGPDGGQVTFGELGQRVNRLANVLARLGLKPGDTVASVQHNGISHFEVILAGTQVGLFVAPVNTHLTPAEASYIINDSGARAVIASHDLAAALDEVRDSLPEHLFAVGAPGGERGRSHPLPGGRQGGRPPGGTGRTTPRCVNRGHRHRQRSGSLAPSWGTPRARRAAPRGYGGTFPPSSRNW